jgi:predicted esterase
MIHHKIKVQKTAHYFTQSTISDTTQYFWIVTHGFGQLASAIIRKFENFDDKEHFVLAPEALNRFYWDMRKGIVGASWMTKQDRLDEIEDYSNFISQLYNEYSVQLPPDCKIILLGFSQGCATQVRWILRGAPRFHHLVLWGGLLPEDLDYQPFKEYFSDKKVHFIIGDEDEFVKPNHIDWHLKFAQEQHLPLNYIPFKGKHEILTDVLLDFFEKEIKVKI